MITVWGRRNSMNVQKVMWTLGELQLDYVRHDMGGSFGTTDEYVAMNPNAVVPTIHDDANDLTLYESNACVRYLAGQYGSGTLLPDDAAQAALGDQWMDWQCSALSPSFFLIFFNMIRVPADKRQDAQVERGVKETARLLAQLDAQLADRDYIMGDRLTMADIPIGAIMYRYFSLDIDRPALPGVDAWYARLCERPSYQKHVMIPFGSNVEEWQREEERNAGVQ